MREASMAEPSTAFPCPFERFVSRMSMKHFHDRTRFVPYLDEMLKTDRQGAIDDMLKVLRECGVIGKIESRYFISESEIERYAGKIEEVDTYQKRDAWRQMAHFLGENGVVQYRKRQEDRGEATYCTVEVIRHD
jgi:hypothetical protein